MEGLISGGAYKRYLIVPNFAAYDNMSGLFGLTANVLVTRTRVKHLAHGKINKKRRKYIQSMHG